MPQVSITTIDNPFNPFTQFSEWYLYDVSMGYNTCSYLARIVNDTDDMSEKEKQEAYEHGIDEMIEHDFMNVYKKVTG